MKKTVLILMLTLLPLTAQARSVKLGENSDVFTGTKSVRKKVCTENKQCITGLCVSGNCVRCNDTDKVCPSDKTCVSGVCKKKADCAQTSDCEAGYDCVSGACIMCASGGQRVQLRRYGSERLRGMPVRIGKLSVRRQVRQVLRLHDMRVGLDQSRKGRPLLLQVNTRRLLTPPLRQHPANG